LGGNVIPAMSGLAPLARESLTSLVVAAELDDDDLRPMDRQRPWETREAAAGSIAADAGIDDAVRIAFVLKAELK
jgi:hypothetical protein